jgi:hypothetical protein
LKRKKVHSVWALVWRPRKTSLGVQTLCIAALLLLTTIHPARADCPAAPIGDPDDMAVSFLKTNGVQAASASLLASSVKEGTLVYDDTAERLKVCDGDNWIDVGSGADTLASLACAAGQIAKYNGTAWACAADGGGHSNAATYSFHVSKSTAFSTSNATLLVPFDVVDLDTEDAFDDSAGVMKYRPAEPGQYYVSLTGSGLGCTASSQLLIYKNGSAVNTNVAAGAAGTSFSLSVDAVVQMNGTSDYLQAYARDNCSSDIGTLKFKGFRIAGGGGSGAALPLSGRTLATYCSYTWTASTTGWRYRT